MPTKYRSPQVSQLAYLIMIAPDGRLLLQRSTRSATDSTYSFNTLWRATIGTEINNANKSPRNELEHLMYIIFGRKSIEFANKVIYIVHHPLSNFSYLDLYVMKITSSIIFEPGKRTCTKLVSYDQVLKDVMNEKTAANYTKDTLIAIKLINNLRGGIANV